jgi:4-aminobutyrate aminotransferase/(S)-3-amino-2-methylpropionate transaminase
MTVSQTLIQVPGPVSKATTEQIDSVFDARAVYFVTDYDKSSGN